MTKNGVEHLPTQHLSRKHCRETVTVEIMFPTVAIVKHVQQDDDYNRFYAQAEVTLSQDVDHAELQLKGVDSSVHASVIQREVGNEYIPYQR